MDEPQSDVVGAAAYLRSVHGIELPPRRAAEVARGAARLGEAVRLAAESKDALSDPAWFFAVLAMLAADSCKET